VLGSRGGVEGRSRSKRVNHTQEQGQGKIMCSGHVPGVQLDEKLSRKCKKHCAFMGSSGKARLRGKDGQNLKYGKRVILGR